MSDRDHGIDAARAGAMLGVIAVHSLASYAETPIGWAVTDAPTSMAADGALWIGRAFLMPVFFVIAGALTRRSLARGGVRAFVGSRARRLLVPLALFLVPVSLSMNALWDWGRELTARASVAAAVPGLEASGAPITLGHLWYLYYLVLFSAIAAGLWRWRRPLATALERLPGAAVPIGVATVLALTLLPTRQLQLDTPLGFAIDPAFAIHYGAFFAWGVAVSPDAFRRWAPTGAVVAVVAFAAVLPDLLASADGAPPRHHAIAASAVFSAASSAAVLGALLRIRTPRLEAPARAAYWTYIVHLPLVVLLQIAVLRVSGPLWLEAAVIVALVSAVALATHRWLIRPTVLARVLG